MERASEGDETMTKTEAKATITKIAESIVAVQVASNNLKMSAEEAVSTLIAKMTADPQLIAKMYRYCGSEMATDAGHFAMVEAARTLGAH